jgi:hypothetical protein
LVEEPQAALEEALQAALEGALRGAPDEQVV